jgi:enoyl-CoA hydratase/carnithine racemase
MSDDLLSEVRNGVMYLTINREDRRNSISPGVIDGIGAGMQRANEDRSIRAIVLTGRGDKAFCAGADLQSSKSFSFDYSNPFLGFADLLRRTRRNAVPMIAAVNGACMAGGMGLMAMCEMVVARKGVLFGLPEVKIGLFPAQVMAVLQHRVPEAILNEMCITGEPVTAERAYEAGFVNYLADDVSEKVDWLVSRVVDKSPAAIRRGLYTMKYMKSMAFDESISFVESQIGLMALTDDAKEGKRSFQEKRKPAWKAGNE